MREEWRWFTVQQLQDDGILLVEDGNHGEYRPRPSEFVEDGVAKFVRASDMTDGRILFDAANSISDVALARIRKGIGQPGDLLFSHKGTVGKLAAAPNDAEPFVCSPQTTFWRVLKPLVLDPGFLYTFMRSPLFVRQWHVRKGETDMADYVSLTAQRRLKVPVPEYREQRQLAATINPLDRSIENNRRRIGILDEMARLLYREWFVHFRFPGHEEIELVDSHLGRIPEGWRHLRLGELAEVMKGLSYKGAYLGDEGMPMANLKCLAPDGGFRRDGVKPYNGPYKDRQSVEPGDIVVANTDLTQAGNVIGSATQLPAAVFGSGGLLSHHLFRVRLKDGVPIGPGYLLSALHDIRFRQWARGCASGTTVLGLRREDAEQYPMLVPSRQVASRFEDAVQPLRELADVLEDQCEVLAEARNLLLPRLTSGELDVSDLNLDLDPVA